MVKKLTTYALLGYLKETSANSTSIADIYIPLVKKALSDYSRENNLSEYKGSSFSEIAEKIKSIFEIDIPIPILSKIMSSICNEINDENIFAVYQDGAFIIKSYVFDDINDEIEFENENIQRLKEDYHIYCAEYGFEENFDELKSFILSAQIDLFTNNQSGFIKSDFHIPKYINERLSKPSIYKIMCNIYLGGIIVSYLEQNITKQVTTSELLLDTNFIISLLDLNTEDAYKTCSQLFCLCKQMGFRFTILNSTINQINILLSNRINDFAQKDFIGSVRVADVFNACIRRNLDKTSLERIKDNLSKIIQEKGIVVIQDAQIRDIIEKARKSSTFKELHEKRKNEDSALNDTVAKIYVESKRGSHIREFVDVKCWFLHNSYSPYDYSIPRKIHERYLISANELLVLLWLSSPAQGSNNKVTDIAHSGITTYVTKYRRAKMPSHEVLKNIKKRVDETLKLGAITEKDTFNLCIRMSEGHLTHSEAIELLDKNIVTNNQFADKLKEFTLEEERIKHARKQNEEKQINLLKEQLDNKDTEINVLKNRLSKLEEAQYLDKRNEYVDGEIGKIKKETRLSIAIAFVIIVLWFVNYFWHNILSTFWSTIVSFALFFISSFGILFFNHTSIKDFFCRKELRKKLEQKYDSKNKRTNDSN